MRRKVDALLQVLTFWILDKTLIGREEVSKFCSNFSFFKRLGKLPKLLTKTCLSKPSFAKCFSSQDQFKYVNQYLKVSAQFNIEQFFRI